MVHGEVLRMEGARVGLPPAWGRSGVPGSPVAGVLWEYLCRGVSGGTVGLGTCVWGMWEGRDALTCFWGEVEL